MKSAAPAAIPASLPDPSEWTNRPLYITAGNGVELSGHGDGESLPLGEKIHFESDIFMGSFYLRLKGIHPYDDDEKMAAHTTYFDGKKRLYQIVIQGQFKKEGLTFADLCLGDVYEKPLKGIPKGRVMRMYEKFMEVIAPGIIMDMTNDMHPKILSPVGGAQTIRADLPGEEPSDYSCLLDSTGLIGDFGGVKKRRKKLSNPKSAKQYKINPCHVYTFECYDHTMDFTNYCQIAMIGIKMKIDLVPVLDGQCMSLGMYLRNDEKCVYKFPLWHEKVVSRA